mmetsp:Transcript_9762/g.24964  ORF Transcript_9762/g.24964 Transcript_9762/m.24964 type:complete len:150 (-) Transcript_9762:149-598(-)
MRRQVFPALVVLCLVLAAAKLFVPVLGQTSAELPFAFDGFYYYPDPYSDLLAPNTVCHSMIHLHGLQVHLQMQAMASGDPASYMRNTLQAYGCDDTSLDMFGMFGGGGGGGGSPGDPRREEDEDDNGGGGEVTQVVRVRVDPAPNRGRG